MLLSGSFHRTFAITAALSVFGAAGVHAQVPIVQPGAPGEPSRLITADDAVRRARVPFSDADVRFMQGMIAHHAQALEMTELLSTRTGRDEMRLLARRIEISQTDEIQLMQDWLRTRGQVVPDTHAHHAPGFEPMPGMLSDEQMTQLSQANGVEFDRLFLRLMIEHHRGALTMVQHLLGQQDSAQDAQLFAFTADVTADQSAEINRMDAMLAELSTDPRVGLRAGFRDAAEAAWNLELVATLPKPEGFFNPTVPAGAPMPGPAEPAAAPDENVTAAAAAGQPESGAAETTEDEAADQPSTRPGAGMLDFANSDMAFAGDFLFAGNFHGFNVYDISNPHAPALVTSVVCPGGQGDLSVAGNLLIMSVEQPRGRVDCGPQGVAEPVSPERFRGIRIFDISDVHMPRQVGAVQTCRGSHTHTLVTDPDEEDVIYVYGSGTAGVRSADELAGCSGESPGQDPDTALFSIDVIEIPVARPSQARIVSRPRVFADPTSNAIAGLWEGGDHGPGTQTTSVTNQCHDITVYPEIGLAAGACSGNGILLDISDPVNPLRIDAVVDPGFAYWHSATFNHDGTKVIFTDEWGGGVAARCRASDPKTWGADALFDIVDRRLVFRSYFKMPAPQTEQENCVAHNGSIIPVPGRDILVQAWYQGGISVIDFTDSSNPVEIAYFDRGPIDATRRVVGGHWSAYWYRGFIYATEIARGLDVLRLLPGDQISIAELAAAFLVVPEWLNVQQQRAVVWPDRPTVARAYLEQLRRGATLDPARLAALARLVDRAEQGPSSTATTLANDLAREATALEGEAAEDSTGRIGALAALLRAFGSR